MCMKKGFIRLVGLEILLLRSKIKYLKITPLRNLGMIPSYNILSSHNFHAIYTIFIHSITITIFCMILFQIFFMGW